MTLLWKLLTNPDILRKSECCGIRVSRKLFGSSLTRQNFRISRKGRIFIELRHHTSNAIGSDTSISIVRSVKTKKSSELKNLILLAAPEKWTLVKAIAFLLVSSSVTMAVPFCFGKVIDVINTMEKKDMKEELKKLTLALFVVFLIGGVSNFSRVYLMSAAGHRITQSLRKKAYAAILRQETAMFDKESTGELVGRLSGMYIIFNVLLKYIVLCHFFHSIIFFQEIRNLLVLQLHLMYLMVYAPLLWPLQESP